LGQPKKGLLGLDSVPDQRSTGRQPHPHYSGTLVALLRVGVLVVDLIELPGAWLPQPFILPRFMKSKTQRMKQR
ncbi:hypothetical protein PIB30_108949, partial [Stylosanthes scabra]|nr:hypothetical protein [Stylosanthes scabra]